MAQQNRINLKSFFITGAKPTQAQFADLIDSTANKLDDGVDIDGNQNLVLNHGITLKNTVDGVAGSIRWSGTVFQFRDGTGWKDLSLGVAASQWVTAGANINYPTGNVGIGVGAPASKLEVDLGNTISQANSVRFGNAAIFNDAFTAYFSHRNQANATSYALSQDTFGSVILNCASTKSISFFENGAVRAAIAGGILTIGAPVAAPAGTLLIVNGNAAKPGGGLWAATSDERLKTDITPFKDGLSLLKKLEPVNYKYNGKIGLSTEGQHVGLIAQQVQKIFPYMVGRFSGKLDEADAGDTELLSLDASALSYVMVNAIKELDERVNKLEKKSAKTSPVK